MRGPSGLQAARALDVHEEAVGGLDHPLELVLHLQPALTLLSALGVVSLCSMWHQLTCLPRVGGR